MEQKHNNYVSPEIELLRWLGQDVITSSTPDDVGTNNADYFDDEYFF